jgi:hypothetical protein
VLLVGAAIAVVIFIGAGIVAFNSMHRPPPTQNVLRQ